MNYTKNFKEHKSLKGINDILETVANPMDPRFIESTRDENVDYSHVDLSKESRKRIYPKILLFPSLDYIT